MAKKKSKKNKIKPVPAKEFRIVWNTNKDSCVLERKNGEIMELGCGITDSVSVYSGNGSLLVLSVNYPARYACLEVFVEGKLEEAIFAESKDIKKMFGKKFASHSPELIAERLFKELDSSRIGRK